MRQTTKIALAAVITAAALSAGGSAVASAAVPASLSTTGSASFSQASQPSQASHAAQAAVASSGVTRSQAIAIAKRQVPGARVTEVEREWEHGHRTWKVELRKGHREYRVYVAITTGRIVKFRAHHDD